MRFTSLVFKMYNFDGIFTVYYIHSLNIMLSNGVQVRNFISGCFIFFHDHLLFLNRQVVVQIIMIFALSKYAQHVLSFLTNEYPPLFQVSNTYLSIWNELSSSGGIYDTTCFLRPSHLLTLPSTANVLNANLLNHFPLFPPGLFGHYWFWICLARQITLCKMPDMI